MLQRQLTFVIKAELASTSETTGHMVAMAVAAVREWFLEQELTIL